jgi:hypothetical protein
MSGIDASAGTAHGHEVMINRLAISLLLALAPMNSARAGAQTSPAPRIMPLPDRLPPPLTGTRQTGSLQLTASLAPNGPALRAGVVWRVFSDAPEGSPAVLVQQSEEAAPNFTLEPGIYIVHAAYGLAGAARRIAVGPFAASERLVLNAGGLKVTGSIGDTPIADDQLRYSVYVPVGNDPEGRVVVENAQGGRLIRLPEGNYRVVSTYGESNAIMSAELKVEAGNVTEATMRHKAATVTLKLVNAPGGEALANTTFSVLTPGGDAIREAIGAFPSMTLAEGEYIAIARNAGQVFTQDFKVRSGFDRDVEVLAKAKAETTGTEPAPAQ